jgi:hypothetical protein
MNCQRFEQVVGDLVRGRIMEADVRTEASVHSEECGGCRARLRDEETLTRGLQLLATEMESHSAAPEMELKLREAFRERHVVVPLRLNSARPRYWWVAVAAVLVVAMTVAAMWWGRSAALEEKIAKEAPPKQVEAPPGPIETGPKDVEYRAGNYPVKQQPPAPKQIRRNTAPRRSRPETQLANHVTNEIATDFMPIGDLNPASLQEGGQIVRVKLRRSALARFGFPVNMDRYNENVKADVLVGIDGLAHAIRFVQ